jgi:hypothetical protein
MLRRLNKQLLVLITGRAESWHELKKQMFLLIMGWADVVVWSTQTVGFLNMGRDEGVAQAKQAAGV